MSTPSRLRVLARHATESALHHGGIRKLQFARNRSRLAADVAAGREHVGRIPGFRVKAHVDPRMQLRVGYTDYLFELPVVWFVRDWLGRGDTFVDVGANVGWFTLLAAAQVGSTGSVTAFEPGNFTFGLLERNLKLNNLNWVTRENVALGDRRGEVELNEGEPGWDAYSSLGQVVHPLAGAGRFIRRRVALVRGADFLAGRGIDRCKLLKIDVEGGELGVLRGFDPWLREGRVEAVLIEIVDELCRSLGHSAAEIWDHMRASGYSWFHLTGYGALEPATSCSPDETMFVALRNPSQRK